MLIEDAPIRQSNKHSDRPPFDRHSWIKTLSSSFSSRFARGSESTTFTVVKTAANWQANFRQLKRRKRIHRN